jgi:hypothetical protein
METVDSSPQLDKDKHEKLRAINVQNILGNESSFGLAKNPSVIQFE